MERVWASRLRWRLRGAALAPLLVVLTIGDALLLHALPLSGDGTGLDAAVLLAALFNFVAVVVVAPVAAVALRRARPDLPFAIARDRVGAVLVLLLTAVLLVAGLHHRPAIVRDRAALVDAHARGVAWIGAHAPAEFRRHAALADTIAIVPGRVYRTCAPSPETGRAWCAVVPRTGPIRFGGGEPNALFQAGRE